ncbi:hypothetical protein CDAR_268271 [Caerostris darwini]|uniref:Uncharacterized protein n=1 Tax=Caerostris darwini TaxID=1538125 RepID=A0AAV4TPA1_9ARAC|nr:hypothetical protein CDAR_268271 [Caerostris darwini]
MSSEPQFYTQELFANVAITGAPSVGVGHPSICGKSRASPRHYGKWQTDRCSESADVGQEETGLRVCGVGWVISRKRRRCYVAEQSALDTPKSTRRPSRLDSSRVGVVVIPVYYMGRSN